MTEELIHYGVKGMKWGVRRYQYTDGTLTPAGKKRYNSNVTKLDLASMRVSQLTNNVRTAATGRQYVDGFLKKGTSFSRIQTSKNFENFAFYATYKKEDIDKYMGLFGKNLTRRAQAEAKRAEKEAEGSKDKQIIDKAKELRKKADDTKVYQLKIEATKKLKVPSDENAGDILHNLLKDSMFKKDLEDSIADSKSKMLRPSQQLLFKKAEMALKKDPDRRTKSDKDSIYKAFNLSLTNHNEYEIRAQDRFYSELKKKGYNALLDYNDKDFSSYHAKRPMIVFDTDSVKLQSVSETNPEIVNTLYRKYNAERISKEAVNNTFGLVGRFGSMTVSQCNSYLDKRFNQYLS